MITAPKNGVFIPSGAPIAVFRPIGSARHSPPLPVVLERRVYKVGGTTAAHTTTDIIRAPTFKVRRPQIYLLNIYLDPYTTPRGIRYSLPHQRTPPTTCTSPSIPGSHLNQPEPELLRSQPPRHRHTRRPFPRLQPTFPASPALPRDEPAVPQARSRDPDAASPRDIAPPDARFRPRDDVTNHFSSPFSEDWRIIF